MGNRFRAPRMERGELCMLGIAQYATGKQCTPKYFDKPVTTAPAKASSGCGKCPVGGEEEVEVVICACVWIDSRHIRRLCEND